jgi:hypothetical protein
MTRDTDVTAVFKGDARYAPKTVKSTAYARVKISTAVSKYYKTATIGSTSYYWFHKSTAPLLTTTMTYYKGPKQRFDLQVYSGGTWHSDDPQYFRSARTASRPFPWTRRDSPASRRASGRCTSTGRPATP